MIALGMRWWPATYWSQGKAHRIFVPARTHADALRALREAYYVCRVDAVPQ